MFIFRFFYPFVKHLGRRLVSLWHCGLLSAGYGSLKGGALLGSALKIPSVKGLHAGKGLRLGDGVSLLCESREDLLTNVSFGDNVKIGDRCTVGAGPGQRLSMGDYSSTHANCYLMGDVSIGRYCLLSANIFISSGEHYYADQPELYIKDQDQARIASGNAVSMPVIVEDDCWIGWGAIIRKGVTIGRGSIIGANSVVTQDIPPYSIAVGAPAKIVKKRILFEPPVRLDASNSAHCPYFYRGFKQAKKEIVYRDGEPVLSMSDKSMVVLKGGSANKLAFKIWMDAESDIQVRFSGLIKSIELKQGWNEKEISVAKDTQKSDLKFFEKMNVIEFEIKNSQAFLKSIEIS